MFKFVGLFLLLSLYGSYLFSQIIPLPPEPVTLKTLLLKGKIASFTVSYYEVKYNQNTESAYHTALDSSASINYYLKIRGENLYVFDSNGFLVERRLFDSLGKPLQTFFTYDKGGFKSIANYSKNKRIDSLYFKNRNNHIAAHKIDVQYSMLFDSRGRYAGGTMYTYNKGNLITIRNKDKDNEIQEMIRYKYKNGRLIEKGIFKADLQPGTTSKINIEKRQNNRVYYSEMRYNNVGKLLGMESFLEDGNGNHLEETIADSNRRVTSQKISEYNDRNEITGQTVFAERKNEYRYEYIYDTHKNWVKQRIYRNNTLDMVIERVFVYAE